MNRRTMLKAAIYLPFVALQSPEPTRLIICDGNSLSARWRDLSDWPTMLASLVAPSYVVNTGTLSIDIGDCRQRAPKVIDTLVGLVDETWVIIWEGTNHLYWGHSVAENYAEHVAYCLERKAAGIDRVFVGTIISREPNNAQYSFAQRHEFNDLLRQNWRSFADGLLDFDAIPQLGADDAWANTDYFRDGVHLADAGSALVAGYVAGRIMPGGTVPTGG